MTAPRPLYQLLVATIDASEGRADFAREAEEDMLMSLETAVWAPELLSPNGPTFTVLELRGAIRRGALRPEVHGRRILVTRRQLADWRSRCRLPANDKPSTLRQACSPEKSAPTENAASAKVLALAIAQRLKSRL